MINKTILVVLASMFLFNFASAGYSWDGEPYTIEDDMSMRNYSGLYNHSEWAYYSSDLFSFNVSDKNASEITLFFHHNKTYSGLWGGKLMFYNFTAGSWYQFPYESFDVSYYESVYGIGAGLYYQDEPYYIDTVNSVDYYVCPNATLPEGVSGTCLYDGRVGAYADQLYASPYTYFMPSYLGNAYFTLSSDFWDENGVLRINVDFNVDLENNAFLTELLPYVEVAEISPQVTLISPIDNSNLSSMPTNFQFIVTDDQFIENVTFFVNGEIQYIDETHTNGTYIIGFSAEEGLNNWSVLAYDNQSLSNQSEVWFFNYTAPEEVIEVIEDDNSVEVYDIMESSGAGLGMLILYMANSLPQLLIVLAFVGMMVLIFRGVTKLLTNLNFKKK